MTRKWANMDAAARWARRMQALQPSARFRHEWRRENQILNGRRK